MLTNPYLASTSILKIVLTNPYLASTSIYLTGFTGNLTLDLLRHLWKPPVIAWNLAKEQAKEELKR